jgi:hypothetical protein
MPETIEISRSGIKFSYLRFISDSTPGYVIVILLFIAYSHNAPLPLIGCSWLSPVNEVSTEARVFVFLLLFIVATPLGLLLNALGWFFFGFITTNAVELCDRYRWLFKFSGTNRSFCPTGNNDHFNMGSIENDRIGDLYPRSEFLHKFLRIYAPRAVEGMDHVRGLNVLFRSLALISLLLALYFCFTMGSTYAGSIFFGLWVFLLVMSSWMEYYNCCLVHLKCLTLYPEALKGKVAWDDFINHIKALESPQR